MGLSALGSLCNDFTKYDKQAQLLVKDIRKGNIIIDLVTMPAIRAVSLITNVNNIIQFCHYIKLLVATCGKCNTIELQEITSKYQLSTPTTKDIKSFGKLLNIVVDKNDNVDFTTQDINNSIVYNHCTLMVVRLSECEKRYQGYWIIMQIINIKTAIQMGAN